eukprot:gene8459-40927_t
MFPGTGDLDREGARWRSGLREDFYRASVPAWEQRIRPPSRPAWVEGPDGMVRDECLTQQWQFGPDRFRFEEATLRTNLRCDGERRRVEEEQQRRDPVGQGERGQQ